MLLSLYFLFIFNFSALYEKRTVKLDAILDSQMNVVVFSPELEEDDYIWEFILGVLKMENIFMNMMLIFIANIKNGINLKKSA